MKREILEIKPTRLKTRAHLVLFKNDSPFKHKVFKPKDAYRRKPKHQKAFWIDEE